MFSVIICVFLLFCIYLGRSVVICFVCCYLFLYCYFCSSRYFMCGPGISVGMATDQELDCPVSNPGGEEVFHTSRPAPGQPSLL